MLFHDYGFRRVASADDGGGNMRTAILHLSSLGRSIDDLVRKSLLGCLLHLSASRCAYAKMMRIPVLQLRVVAADQPSLYTLRTRANVVTIQPAAHSAWFVRQEYRQAGELFFESGRLIVETLDALAWLLKMRDFGSAGNLYDRAFTGHRFSIAPVDLHEEANHIRRGAFHPASAVSGCEEGAGHGMYSSRSVRF